MNFELLLPKLLPTLNQNQNFLFQVRRFPGTFKTLQYVTLGGRHDHRIH